MRSIFSDDGAGPIVLDDLARRRLEAALRRARTCFDAAPELSAIAVCGDIQDRPGKAAQMSVPTVLWLGAYRRFDFTEEMARNDALAAAAMRFQNAAVPYQSDNILSIVMAQGKTPFVDHVLHIARSGRVRLLWGSPTLQNLRFMERKGRPRPDLAGIRPVFTSEPSQHDILNYEATAEADLVAFQ